MSVAVAHQRSNRCCYASICYAYDGIKHNEMKNITNCGQETKEEKKRTRASRSHIRFLQRFFRRIPFDSALFASIRDRERMCVLCFDLSCVRFYFSSCIYIYFIFGCVVSRTYILFVWFGCFIYLLLFFFRVFLLCLSCVQHFYSLAYASVRSLSFSGLFFTLFSY